MKRSEPSYLYLFEEIGPDLHRPPMAAMRALFTSGIMVSPTGWRELPGEARKALCIEGTRATVSSTTVRALLREASLAHVKLVGAVKDPDRETPPAHLRKALEGIWPLTDDDWQSLTSLDRFVLFTVAPNSRLLARAVVEIMQQLGDAGALSPFWRGDVAHVELSLSPAALSAINSQTFYDGRSLALARSAGVKAARATSDLLDLTSQEPIGNVELDWLVRPGNNSVLFQAHASTWNGAFAQAASLLAACATAVALRDMLRDIDRTASISIATIACETWQVGSGMFADEATAFYEGS